MQFNTYFSVLHNHLIVLCVYIICCFRDRILLLSQAGLKLLMEPSLATNLQALNTQLYV